MRSEGFEGAEQMQDRGTAPEKGTVYRFGPFTLDTAAGRVSKDGEGVHLRPQAYALLKVLVERAPALLSRDELLDLVWGVEHLSPSTLKQTVSELRAALGDDPRRPRIIETVHRRGYRLKAPVEVSAAPRAPRRPVDSPPDRPNGAPPPGSRRRVGPRVALLALVVVGLAALTTGVLTRRRSAGTWIRPGVLVLPVRGTGWEGAYAAEELARALAADGAMRVVPVQSMTEGGFRVKDLESPEGMGSLRRALAVDYLAVVAVKRSGAGPQLSVRLAETAGGGRLASFEVPWDRARAAALAMEVVSRIRQRVGPAPPRWGSLPPEPVTPLAAKPEALRLYTEGMGRLRAFDASGAVAALERAVELQPDSPFLHRSLAQAYRLLGAQAKARRAAEEALRLAAGLPRMQRLELEASAADCALRRTEAIRKYQALTELVPDVPENWLRLMRLMVWAGRAKEAVEIGRRLEAEGRFTGDPRVALELAGALDALDRHREAEAAAARAVEEARARRLPLVEAAAMRERAWAVLRLGRTGEALEFMAGAGELFRAGGFAWGWAATLADRAGVLLQQGRLEDARSLYLEMVRVARENGDLASEATARHNLASIQARRGDLKGAAACLERVLELKKRAGDVRGQASVLATLASVRKGLGDSEGARSCFQRAAELYRSAGERDGLARALRGLADLEALGGGTGGAERRYREVLAIFRGTGNGLEEARTLTRLGELAERRGALSEAVTRYREADAIFQRVDARDDRAWNLVALACLERRLGAPGAADTLREARRLAEDLGDGELLRKIEALDPKAAAADGGSSAPAGPGAAPSPGGGGRPRW